jgi:hypothetical protein
LEKSPQFFPFVWNNKIDMTLILFLGKEKRRRRRMELI